MRTNVPVVAAFAAGVAFLTLVPFPAAAQSAPNQATAPAGPPTISVTGEAVVSVAPDRVLIHLGVEILDPDVNAARRRNDEALRQAIAAVRDAGVPADSIRTEQVSIEPRYRHHEEGADLVGFVARTTFLVILSDPARTGEIVSRALLAGANQLHGVAYETAELPRHRDRARELALQAARTKAEKMAAVLGRSAGPPLHVQETIEPVPWRYAGAGRFALANVAQDMAASTPDLPDPLALGKITVRAGVSVIFELRP